MNKKDISLDFSKIGYYQEALSMGKKFKA